MAEKLFFAHIASGKAKIFGGKATKYLYEDRQPHQVHLRIVHVMEFEQPNHMDDGKRTFAQFFRRNGYYLLVIALLVIAEAANINKTYLEREEEQTHSIPVHRSSYFDVRSFSLHSRNRQINFENRSAMNKEH